MIWDTAISAASAEKSQPPTSTGKRRMACASRRCTRWRAAARRAPASSRGNIRTRSESAIWWQTWDSPGTGAGCRKQARISSAAFRLSPWPAGIIHRAMVLIPQEYQAARSTLEFDSVTIGHFDIEVFPLDQIESWRIRYSGSWQTGWLIIGWEDLRVGALILDTDDSNFRVLYASYIGTDIDPWGPDVWEAAITIATTLNGFLEAIRELKRLSLGRDSPDSLKANPVSAAERSAFLARIARICTGWEGAWFWESRLD
jgi:hypothetical protein